MRLHRQKDHNDITYRPLGLDVCLYVVDNMLVFVGVHDMQ